MKHSNTMAECTGGARSMFHVYEEYVKRNI